MGTLTKFSAVWLSIALLALAGCGGPAADQTSPAATSAQADQDEDPDRVLMEVDGKKLRVWQADALAAGFQDGTKMSNRRKAVAGWIEVTLKANEARRRGMHKTKANAVHLMMIQESFLSSALNDEVLNAIPGPTAEQVKEEYSKDPGKYRRPPRVSVQHVTVKQRDVAEKVARLAKEGADFDKLVKEYSINQDRRRKGLWRQSSYNHITTFIGAKVRAAVDKAEVGDIVGPVRGKRGFEVVKVLHKLASTPVGFSEVEDSIKKKLTEQMRAAGMAEFLESLREKAKIVDHMNVD